MRDMFCRQVQSHLDDYILDRIDKELFDQIDNHLKECLNCQKHLAKNKQLIVALKSLPTPDPGDHYWQQMEDSILSRVGKQTDISSEDLVHTSDSRLTSVSRYLIPLAASILLLLGSLLSDEFDSDLNMSSKRNVDYTISSQMYGHQNETSYSELTAFTALFIGIPGSPDKYISLSQTLGGY